MQKRVFRVYFHTCFLCVHGRAWYPLLPFEWPPGQKIRFQALWKTKSFVKVCLKFKLPLWTKGLLIHLSPLWHFPRWHNFPVYSKLMIYRLPPLMFSGMLVIMTTLLCIERIPLSHIKTRSVVLIHILKWVVQEHNYVLLNIISCFSGMLVIMISSVMYWA